MIIDTSINCLGKSNFLKSKGVNTVGRYYRKATHSERRVTKAEAQELSATGIKLFTVFEDYGKEADLVLTSAQGKIDGESARDQARLIGQPQGTPIYFAVEGLPHGYKSGHLPAIRDYFSGVKNKIGSEFSLGVYGDGIVCRTLLAEGICKFTWLAAASTSFEGTCEFFGSKKWNLAQLPPLDIEEGWNGLRIDIDHNNAKLNGGDFGSFLVPFP